MGMVDEHKLTNKKQYMYLIFFFKGSITIEDPSPILDIFLYLLHLTASKISCTNFYKFKTAPVNLEEKKQWGTRINYTRQMSWNDCDTCI